MSNCFVSILLASQQRYCGGADLIWQAPPPPKKKKKRLVSQQGCCGGAELSWQAKKNKKQQKEEKKVLASQQGCWAEQNKKGKKGPGPLGTINNSRGGGGVGCGVMPK